MILLKDIWPIEKPEEYKVHFARWNGVCQPLDTFVRDKTQWQEYRPKRDEFNRSFIFSLAQFYHENDAWLFGGIFCVVARGEKGYKVELLDSGGGFIGRLKLHLPYRDRPTRVKFENHYNDFEVIEILREPYSGRQFPGYDDIVLSFEELETLVKTDRPDWKAALENIKGIYLISDIKTGKRYVGSAYGDRGIWSRWSDYVDTGHGGNVELRTLIDNPSLDYCRSHFRFALLEHRSSRTPDDVIQHRETFWKEILLMRGQQGLNRN